MIAVYLGDDESCSGLRQLHGAGFDPEIFRQADGLEIPRIEDFCGDGFHYIEFEAGIPLPQAEIAANRTLD